MARELLALDARTLPSSPLTPSADGIAPAARTARSMRGRRRVAFRTRSALVALLVGVTAGIGSGRAIAAPSSTTSSCDQGCWMRALSNYHQNPTRSRRAFLALEALREGPLPTVVLLSLAEAHLRVGEMEDADRLFAEVLATNAGPPFEGWAHLGRGGIALQSADWPRCS